MRFVSGKKGKKLNMGQASPEIANSLCAGEVTTNFHDVGDGKPILLIHGSGPGVSAWANWRLVLPKLEFRARAIAPDMAGFGYSEVHGELKFDIDMWLEQLNKLLDHLSLQEVAIVGNSFGGGVGLHFAERFPEKVNKLVLMGSVGSSFNLTDGLDKVWGYEPTLENMRELIRVFAYNEDIVTEDLVELRYKASNRSDVQERFSSLFPAPRQRWIEALAVPEEKLRDLNVPVLLIHGVDDRVIPIEASRKLHELLPNSELVEIPHCGHWVQIEKTDQFVQHLASFLGLG